MSIGYACINMQLAEKGITTNRGMIRKTFMEKGIAYASQLALQNVLALLQILDWNITHNIPVFRVTSDLFPWASEYALERLPDYTEIRSLLEAAGKLPIRISTHPGPFNKLAGTGATLDNTIKELETHSQIFDLMNLPLSHWSKINIHIGGAYGDKMETINRFAQNFKKLSANLQSRLTVENDDKRGLFTVAELLALYKLTGIPIVFDYFHHKLNPGMQTEEEAFLSAFNTWNTKPLFHYSSSRRDMEDAASKREAHSDWAHEKINMYGKDIDLILETKMKELSVLRYREMYEK